MLSFCLFIYLFLFVFKTDFHNEIESILNFMMIDDYINNIPWIEMNIYLSLSLFLISKSLLFGFWRSFFIQFLLLRCFYFKSKIEVGKVSFHLFFHSFSLVQLLNCAFNAKMVRLNLNLASKLEEWTQKKFKLLSMYFCWISINFNIPMSKLKKFFYYQNIWLVHSACHEVCINLFQYISQW